VKFSSILMIICFASLQSAISEANAEECACAQIYMGPVSGSVHAYWADLYTYDPNGNPCEEYTLGTTILYSSERDLPAQEFCPENTTPCAQCTSLGDDGKGSSSAEPDAGSLFPKKNTPTELKREYARFVKLYGTMNVAENRQKGPSNNYYMITIKGKAKRPLRIYYTVNPSDYNKITATELRISLRDITHSDLIFHDKASGAPSGASSYFMKLTATEVEDGIEGDKITALVVDR
jgi:hypothetical protein